jgi:hypothetical protein
MAFLDVNTALNGELIAARTGKVVVVENYMLTGSAAGTVQIESDGTAITGAMAVSATKFLNPPYVYEGLLITEPGESLDATLTGGITLHGYIQYHYR